MLGNIFYSVDVCDKFDFPKKTNPEKPNSTVSIQYFFNDEGKKQDAKSRAFTFANTIDRATARVFVCQHTDQKNNKKVWEL